MSNLKRLFRPRSVAIIGASDKNPWSAFVAHSLATLGFQGPVHLVNSRGTPALNRQTVRSCTELTGVDAAFMCVPAAALAEAVEDMAAGGIRFGAVVTSGFAEVGPDGAREQARIFNRAHELGVTLLGPNSLGFSNFVDRVSLSAIPIKTPLLDKPRVGLISQSGATAAMIYAFANQQNVSLSYSIAMGNEATVNLGDVIDFLVADESTRAIAIFAEAIRDPARFEAAARAAVQARKPIVILKLGTGELTATVAQAHTGALVGEDRVFQAICDAYKVVRVASLEDLVVTADVLAATGPIDAQKGFALVSISGGACELVSDRGEELGLRFPPFAPATLEKLSRVIAEFGAAHNPLDLTGAAMRNPEIYAGAIQAIGSDPDIGLIGVIAEVATARESTSSVSEAALREMAAGFAGTPAPGLLIHQYIKPISDYGRALLAQHNLPPLTGGIDHAVRAVAHLYHWSRRLQQPMPSPRPAALPSTVRPATEHETLKFLAGAGVPVIPQRLAASRAEAIAAARDLGGPVVLKILSPDIQHKSEVGGVRLDLLGDGAVGDAYDAMLRDVRSQAPSARIAGAIVSPMRRGGIELIVGIARDPMWGLVMAVGLGGVWVELLKDTSLRVLPVDAAAARCMLTGLKAAKLLQGYRGTRPADLDVLAATIAAIGDAASSLGDSLETLEINPLRVDGAIVEALDALAIWSRA